MKKIYSLVAICLVMVMVLTACGSAASQPTSQGSATESTEAAKAPESVTLKLAHTQSTEHPVHKTLEKFAELVEEKSGGTVKVEIYANGVLGDERKCIESLQTGLIDMAKVSVDAMVNFEELYSIFSIPYAFEGIDHCRKFMNSDNIQDIYTSTVDTLDILGLTWYDAGGRNYYTKDTPIIVPEDMKGLTMRVQSSQILIKTVETLGGSATPVDWSELYTAIQQGVVDGADNGIVAFADNNLCEVAKHFSFTQHVLSPDILLIKNSVFEKLTPEQQQAVRDAAKESTSFHDESWGAYEQTAIEKCEEAGVNIYYPDLSLFSEALAPLKAELATNEKVAEYLKIIDEMK